MDAEIRADTGDGLQYEMRLSAAKDEKKGVFSGASGLSSEDAAARAPIVRRRSYSIWPRPRPSPNPDPHPTLTLTQP